MFVFHTQFNILSWIFGTFLFHVVLILKKNQYLFTFFLVSSPWNYLLGLFV